MCVEGGQGTTRVIQPSGMLSVMHTAAHSHKMRKVCSDALLINDGGSVNTYIVSFFFCCCQSDNPCQTGRRVSGGCSDGVRQKTCDFVAYPCDSVTSAVVSKCCCKYCVLPLSMSLHRDVISAVDLRSTSESSSCSLFSCDFKRHA